MRLALPYEAWLALEPVASRQLRLACCDAKPLFELPSSFGGHPQRTAIQFSCDPITLNKDSKDGGGESAAEVRPALAPIQAGKCKSSTELEQLLHVDSQSLERDATSRREIDVRCVIAFEYPIECPESVEERHTQRPGDMVVTGSGLAQTMRRAWAELGFVQVGEYVQGFQRGCDFRPVETVVPVPALGQSLHQLLPLKALKVDTRR